jgi:transcription elongation factor GreA
LKKKVILTDEGFKRLTADLEELKTTKRKEVTEKIKLALSFGDLSENSEYDEAKNEQAFIEARILQLDAMLKGAQVLEATDISTDVVSIGVSVTVKDLDQQEEARYYIVNPTEVDPFNFKISDESPVGKALLAHRVGDRVLVETPSGSCHLEILQILPLQQAL